MWKDQFEGNVYPIWYRMLSNSTNKCIEFSDNDIFHCYLSIGPPSEIHLCTLECDHRRPSHEEAWVV